MPGSRQTGASFMNVENFPPCPGFGDTNKEVTALRDFALQARDRAYCPHSHFRVGAALLTKTGYIITGSNVENVAFPTGTCAERVALGTAIASAGVKDFKAVGVATDRVGKGGAGEAVGQSAIVSSSEPGGVWVPKPRDVGSKPVRDAGLDGSWDDVTVSTGADGGIWVPKSREEVSEEAEESEDGEEDQEEVEKEEENIEGFCSPCGNCRQALREFCELDTPIYMFDARGKYIVRTLGQLLPLSFGPGSLNPPKL
ncbi:MAG: hypothetical protein Q9159_006510 [Coniocarpon cinnabarinum]